MLDIDAYFQRIGFTGRADCSLETLQQIHLLHPTAIAFENINAFISEEVSLDPERVFDKLVHQGRGGYCFEHNLILATVLRQIGFEVGAHAARVVWRSPDKTQMARTHMLLKVMIGSDPWIADVGFGGITMTAPVLLATDQVQHSPHEDFRITGEHKEYIIAAKLPGNWQSMYVFDLVPQYPVDFEMANHFVSTHPQSLFLHNLMLGRPCPEGRHAMQNRCYTQYSLDGEKQERDIRDTDEFMDLLLNTFNIQLSDKSLADKLREKFTNLD